MYIVTLFLAWLDATSEEKCHALLQREVLRGQGARSRLLVNAITNSKANLEHGNLNFDKAKRKYGEETAEFEKKPTYHFENIWLR